MTTSNPNPSTEGDRIYLPPFVVPDPCTVFRDALHYSPWTDDGGSLPQRGDWSTYRLASKDIILGVVTHRFNSTTRCLDVRSYFCGEHPLFEELEATRALMAMLLCQAYQTGSTLQIHFEHGIPFDVRMLIERNIGESVSGHSTLIGEELAERLFIRISGLSPQMQARIAANGVGVGTVCYHVLRGTWSSRQIKGLLERGVPLTWLFSKCPDPIGSPALYGHLVHHLRALLLEDYALKRLEDRQFGETTSKHISETEGELHSYYVSEQPLHFVTTDAVVRIAANREFTIVPVLLTSDASPASIPERCAKALSKAEDREVIIVIPLDCFYSATSGPDSCAELLRRADVHWVVVGQTMTQLLSEVEQKLAITSSQMDDNEVDALNVDKHTD